MVCCNLQNDFACFLLLEVDASLDMEPAMSSWLGLAGFRRSSDTPDGRSSSVGSASNSILKPAKYKIIRLKLIYLNLINK